MAFTTPRTWVDGEVLSAATFNAHVRDNIDYFYEGDSWHNVTGGVGFQNSWQDYGTPWSPCRYRKVGDLTTIQGLCKLGARPATIFTLPAGYRPGKNLIFGTHDAGGGTVYSELRVQSTGEVICEAGANNAFFSVACTFLAEQ